MREREYIDVTNLVKVRMMKAIMHDTLPMTPEEKADEQAIFNALRRWEDRLQKAITTDDET